nr:hypothetical protein Iba_chr10cCG4150 [Ipomoea batatas]
MEAHIRILYVVASGEIPELLKFLYKSIPTLWTQIQEFQLQKWKNSLFGLKNNSFCRKTSNETSEKQKVCRISLTQYKESPIFLPFHSMRALHPKTSKDNKIKNSPGQKNPAAECSLESGFRCSYGGITFTFPRLIHHNKPLLEIARFDGLELGLVVVAKPHSEVEGRGRLQQAGGSRGETGGGAAAAREDWERVRGDKIVCNSVWWRRVENYKSIPEPSRHCVVGVYGLWLGI